MNALVSAAQLSSGGLVSPYAGVAAVAARPARRSPLIIATIDLVAILVALGVIQVVNGKIAGVHDVQQLAASEQPVTEGIAGSVPPMPRFAGHTPAVPGQLPAEAILFAEPIAYEAFGSAVSGPAPGRFALVESSSSGAGDTAGRSTGAAAGPAAPSDTLLSYQSQPVARRVVATVAAVQGSVEDVAASTLSVVSPTVEAASEQVAASTSSTTDAATQSAASAVAAATTTTTSAASSMASEASSAVSEATGVVGGLLN